MSLYQLQLRPARLRERAHAPRHPSPRRRTRRAATSRPASTHSSRRAACEALRCMAWSPRCTRVLPLMLASTWVQVLQGLFTPEVNLTRRSNI